MANFFWNIIILVGLIIIFDFFRVCFLVRRFLVIADDVIGIYTASRELLKSRAAMNQVHNFVVIYETCQIEFSNVDEACDQLERMIKKALNYYETLDCICMGNNPLINWKYKLIDINTELRILRWKNS